MKLALKLSLAMGFLSMLMCTVGIFSLYQMYEVNQASTDITENWLPSVVHAQRLNTLGSNYRIQEIMHIYSTDQQDMLHYEQQMQKYINEFDKYNVGYKALLSSPEERRTYEEFMTHWKTYTAAHDEIYGLSKQNKTQEAVSILTTRSRSAFNAAREALEKSVKLNTEGADQASLYGDRAYADARIWIVGVLITAMLLALGLTLFIVRGTLKQLGKDPGDLAHIARRVVNGDYAIDDGSPKIGVYGNIVEMVAALKEHIDAAQRESERAAGESLNARQAMEKAEAASAEAQAKTDSMLRAADKLEEVANIVSSASNELSAQIEQSERGATEQAARVTETATAMEEMNSTVIEVARNAGQASEVSSKTREKADDGAGIVRQAVASIQQVHANPWP